MILQWLSGCARFSLQELYLTGNQINGTLPDLSIFSALKTLDISENQLHGKIPESNKLPSLLESLSIRSNILEGGIPKSFGNACALRSLDMSNNSLSEEFPMIIHHLSGCARYSLEQLSLSMNQINGTLPDLSIFSSLRGLYLYGNKLNGEIPKDIKFPPQLEELDMQSNSLKVETLYQLDLSNNRFSEKISDCWSHFKSLSYLDLSHNNFSGRIPTSIGSLLNLQALLLRNNNLTNAIPFSLRNCTNLVMLDIAENKLSGLIPAWIGSELQELQFLSLGRNNFHGSLPLKFCYLSNILLLDLSLNNMSGQIPKCIKNFTSMTQKTSSRDYHGHSYFVKTSQFSGPQPYDLNALLMWKGSEQMFKNSVLLLLESIDLSSNHFSGEIPLEIENLFGLVSLNLSRNHLTGKIPSNIGKLTSLDFLDLSRNHLVGSIPLSLTQIDRLGMLDLSHNNLSGEIPTDNLDLCGPPLEKLCIDGKPAQEPIVKLPEDENLLFTREFYMSMAIGFVISFWGVFGSILINRSWRHAYFKFISNFSDAIYVMAAVKVFKWHHRG
uniref:Uncharacterized protein n=1 Tax=Glycine max TaxID=3847 RepID=A0A0R0FZQ5_SOYBN